VLRAYVCVLQEEQEELAVVEAEARQELKAAQQALAEAQEALAVTSDKVGPACTAACTAT
jgi:precorrin-3B methylase